MLRKIVRDIVNDTRDVYSNKFFFIYSNNEIYLENIDKISHFTEHEIWIKYKEGRIIIKGNSLVIKKSYDNALLIGGTNFQIKVDNNGKIHQN